jgi:hypothetical protein
MSIRPLAASVLLCALLTLPAAAQDQPADAPAPAAKPSGDVATRLKAFLKSDHDAAVKKAKDEAAAAQKTYESTKIAPVRAVGVVENGTAALDANETGNKTQGLSFPTPAEKNAATREAYVLAKRAQMIADALEKSATVPFFTLTGEQLPTTGFGRFENRSWKVTDPGSGAEVEVTPSVKVVAVQGEDQFSARYVLQSAKADARPSDSRIFAIKGLPTADLKPGQTLQPEDVFEVLATTDVVDENNSHSTGPLLVKVDADKVPADALAKPLPPGPTALPVPFDQAEAQERFVEFVRSSMLTDIKQAQEDFDAASAKFREVSAGRVAFQPKPGSKVKPPKIPAGALVFQSNLEKTKAVSEASAALREATNRLEDVKKSPNAPFFDPVEHPAQGAFGRFDLRNSTKTSGNDRITLQRTLTVYAINGPEDMTVRYTTKTTKVTTTPAPKAAPGQPQQPPAVHSTTESLGSRPVVLRGIPTRNYKVGSTFTADDVFEVWGVAPFLEKDGSTHIEPVLYKRDFSSYLKAAEAEARAAEAEAKAAKKAALQKTPTAPTEDKPADPNAPAPNTPAP